MHRSISYSTSTDRTPPTTLERGVPDQGISRIAAVLIAWLLMSAGVLIAWLLISAGVLAMMLGSSGEALAESEPNHPDIDPFGMTATLISPTTDHLAFYHQDESGEPYGNVAAVNKALKSESKTLSFATNGGIFMDDLTPLGLYIESGTVIRPLNTVRDAYGNFYLQPNGVFALMRDGQATILTTDAYDSSYPDHGRDSTNPIQYATQSGPMLLIDGEISDRLLPDSSSYKIRNGVGLLANGDLIFAKSWLPITFYDFAAYFQSIGAEQALYLDGSISMHHEPTAGHDETGGEFGIIIGTTEPLSDDS